MRIRDLFSKVRDLFSKIRDLFSNTRPKKQQVNLNPLNPLVWRLWLYMIYVLLVILLQIKYNLQDLIKYSFLTHINKIP